MTAIAGIMMSAGEPPPPALEAMAAALSRRGRHRSIRHVVPTVVLLQMDDSPSGAATDPASGAASRPVVDGQAIDAGRGAAGAEAADMVLACYRSAGLAGLARLRGGHALALYDPAAEHLVLRRDAFGAKPLYYIETGWGFAFASELRAFLAAELLSAELSARARAELLQLQFITGRECIVSGIRRLLPGETLVIGKGKVIDRRRVAALPHQPPSAGTEAELLGRLEAALDTSIALYRDRRRSTAVLLGPGVHSAALLVGMHRQSVHPLSTCGVHFGWAAGAEDAARRASLARGIGAEHLEVEFTERDFWALLPQVAEALDDPAADYGAALLWKLAGRLAGQVEVLLAAEGGREIFAAHSRYRSTLRPWWLGGRAMRARGVLHGFGVLREGSPDWRDGIVAAESAAAGRGRTQLQVAQATDCADWLPNSVLLRLDRCLARHGIEGRTPLLDSVVAATAFALADHMKVRDGQGSWLLRRWLDTVYPAANPWRPLRRTPTPVGLWIAGHGASLGRLVAAQPGIVEICEPAAVRKLFSGQGKRVAFAAWTLLFYALWHQHHVCRVPSGADVFTTLGTRA